MRDGKNGMGFLRLQISTRPNLLILPKSPQQLGTKYSNIEFMKNILIQTTTGTESLTVSFSFQLLHEILPTMKINLHWYFSRLSQKRALFTDGSAYYAGINKM